MLSQLTTSAQTTVWSEDFENNPSSRWTVSNGTWEMGFIDSGPGDTRDGSFSAAGTVLGGNYTDNRQSRLYLSNSITVPAASENPRLRFWHWWSFATQYVEDIGRVEVTADGGETWEILSPTYTASSSGEWTRPSLDLSAYAGQNVQIGFYFQSRSDFRVSPGTSSGWYIDEVEIETGAVPVFVNPEGFEFGNDFSSWTADFGIWEIGEPTSGPSSAYSGSQVLATKLEGNYTDDRVSRMSSPVFTVPAASENPRLRFWHWWSFATQYVEDIGRVEVTADGGETWEILSPTYSASSSGEWTRPSLDLSAYAGQNVQIGFCFQSRSDFRTSSGTSFGWYIDEVEILADCFDPNTTPSTQTIDEHQQLVVRDLLTTDAATNGIIVEGGTNLPSGAYFRPGANGRYEFVWTPSEVQGPGIHDIELLAQLPGSNLTLLERSSIRVVVNEVNDAPDIDPIPGNPFEVDAGSTLTFTAGGSDPDAANQPYLGYQLEGLFTDGTLGAWTTWQTSGSAAWLVFNNSGNNVALVWSRSSNVAGESWLISEPVDFDASTEEVLRFDSEKQVDGFDLEVLYSADYSGSGDPSLATWQALTVPLPQTGDGMTPSGDIDVSAINGTAVYLAFKYTADDTDKSRWLVDNIELTGTLQPIAQTLTYSLVNGPSGASINPTTGAFSWTPSAAQAGTHTFQIKLEDDGVPPLSALSETIEVLVKSGNQPPVWPTPLPTPVVDEGDLLQFTMTADDPDGSTLVYSLSRAPAGMSINASTGVVFWQTDETDGPNTYSFSVFVDDTENPPVEASVTVMVNEVNQAPEITGLSSNPQARSYCVGETISFTVSASDLDIPQNGLTFDLEPGAPTGAMIGAASGIFEWTPSVGDIGIANVSISVTDTGVPALSDTITVALAVLAPPDIAVAPSGTISMAAEGGSTDTASLTIENTGGCELSWSFSADVGWLSANPNSGANASGTDTTLALTADATGLAAGTYNATVTISSNDPDESSISVPITLSVSQRDFVQVSAIDASNFTTICATVFVDTDAGINGKLTQSDFAVSEDGVPQVITSFSAASSGNGAVADIVFVFDDSGSMGDEIATMKSEATNFASSVQSANIDARFALISFNHATGFDLDFTSNVPDFQNAVNLLAPDGGLGSFGDFAIDSVQFGLDNLTFRSGAQKIIILITDEPTAYRGDGSNTSSVTIPEVTQVLIDSGVTLFAASPSLSNQPDGDTRLLAEGSGGFWLDINASDFDLILAEIATTITSTYTVCYETINDLRDGTMREVVIEVSDPVQGSGSDNGFYTAPLPIVEACRSLPFGYGPGVPFAVEINIVPDLETQNYAVEDSVPAGWSVANISDGGVFDSQNEKVKFGPFTDNLQRILSYEVTPPLSAVGEHCFDGLLSIDGAGFSIGCDTCVIGETRHPADVNPEDDAIDINELTAYGNYWKRGLPWPTGPNPIPIDYYARAGYLWRNGECYVFDGAVGSLPLAWESCTQQSNSIVAMRSRSVESKSASSAVATMPISTLPDLQFDMPVTIAVNLTAGTSFYAVEDGIPQGLQVITESISDGGAFDTVNRKVKWGPFFDDNPRKLSYTVSIPADLSFGISFVGLVSANGVNTVISGDRSLAARPARASYSDWRSQAFANPTAAMTGMLEDFNGDGVPNIMSYALGVSPSDSVGPYMPEVRVLEDHEPGEEIRYAFRFSKSANDLRFTIESFTDLLNLANSEKYGVGDVQLVGEDEDVWIYEIGFPKQSEPARFMRLNIDQSTQE